jgi:hypothetical protein
VKDGTETKFLELLERVGDLTPDEEMELGRLSRALDERDAQLDAQIRAAFRELDDGHLVRVH